MRRRRGYLAAVSAVLLAAAVTPTYATPTNVLVIVADDMGWGDLSLQGNTNLATPHLDSLAHQGASFEQFFVQPVCAPTRADFLTGRWHLRGGVRGVSSGGERLDLDERTIAEAFKAGGYATACFGKWHNGSQYPYHPNARGFDEYYGFTSGHWGEYFDPPLDHNGEAVRGEGYLPDDLTARAIKFMQEQHGGKTPFFCYVAFNTPHSPMQVPDPHWAKFETGAIELRGAKAEDEDVAHTRAALAMCENLDGNVGQMLAALDGLSAARDTIVVFFSDNGPDGARWNGGMRGRKGDVDDGGVRSALHIRWPARIQPETVIEPLAGAIDLYPTLATLAGVTVTSTGALDGVDLSPLLLGKVAEMPELNERLLFARWGGRMSVRSQQHRLDHQGRLYDIKGDPGQTTNIAAEFPAVTQRLASAGKKWQREMRRELNGEDDRPFPVGHADRAATVLPARDGIPHGGIQRSAKPANCSFFTNWTGPDDAMNWSVEVLTDARYEAIVHYTCGAPDVGSTVRLTLGDATWSGIIEAAFDPPLRGMEHDRVVRAESYVKDFRPLSLGAVALKAGRGTLTLRATEVMGREVGDVRSVELRRLE
jgi:arylsulfatase A-like enzyme